MRIFEHAGKWYCDLHYFNEHGRKKRRRICTKISVGEGRERERSEQKARLVASRIEFSFAAGKGDRKKPPTLAECITYLGEDLIRKKRAEATKKIVLEKSLHLFKHLKDSTPITNIQYQDLVKYADIRIGEEAHRHTIHRELRTLRQAWKVARSLGKVDIDPPPMPDLGQYYKPKERVLTQDEVKKVIMAVPAKWTEHIIMYLHTGCSATELERIRGDGCDWENDMVHIPGTKAESRDRWIPMTGETRPILKKRVKERGDGLLFDRWTGKQSALKKACDKKHANLEPVSPNDLRRTYATEMANAGVPILVLQRLMGHSSGRMLEKVYAQIDTQAKKEAVRHLPSYTKRNKEGNGDS